MAPNRKRNYYLRGMWMRFKKSFEQLYLVSCLKENSKHSTHKLGKLYILVILKLESCENSKKIENNSLQRKLTLT